MDSSTRNFARLDPFCQRVRLSGEVHVRRVLTWHFGTRARSYEDDSWAWEGFVVEYIQKLRLITLDTPWPLEEFTFTFTSGGSRASHKSVFDACVNDVQNGLVDMCAGSFWITDGRLEMASFTKAIYEEDHILFVPKRGVDTKETFAEMANKAFRVFDSSLWLMVLGLNVFIGWVDAWMNKEEWRTDKWSEYNAYKKFKVKPNQPAPIPTTTVALTAWVADVCVTLCLSVRKLPDFAKCPAFGEVMKTSHLHLLRRGGSSPVFSQISQHTR